MAEGQKKDVIKMENYLIGAIIKAKQKEVRAEKMVTRAGLLVLTCLGGIVGYINFQWNTYTEYSSPLSQLIADPIILILMFLLGFSYVYLQNKKFKFEKAEKDFDTLKDDMIDRASEIWTTREAWNARNEVFHELKKKYDINLFHK